MVEKRLLNVKEAASYLNLAEQTLHNYRFTRKPPNYVKLGKRVLYELSELEKFIESNRVKLNS
jgi:predicted DNA-binding transcriptional regulator AlpA